MNKKRKKIKIDVLFMIVFLLIIGNGVFLSAVTCSRCSECTSTIANASDGDIIEMIDFLGDEYTTCINFNGKSNLVFDCLNNLILNQYLTQSSLSIGIKLTSASNNNTIRNCNISSFRYGVSLFNSTNNTFDNLIIGNNTSGGIYINRSDNNRFTNIHITNNSDGIDIYGGSNNSFTNVTASYNSVVGIYAIDTGGQIDFNTFINVTANYNGDTGISFEPSGSATKNNLTNIVASGNVGNGITLLSCNNFILRNVTTNNNSATGMYLQTANNNNLTNVTSNNNVQQGIYLDNSNYNQFTNVTLNDNGQYGMDITTSNYNNLTDFTFYSDGAGSLRLTSSSNNILTNINDVDDFSGEKLGILLQTSSNDNILTNITSNNHSADGIKIDSSNNNVLTNIITNYNSYFGPGISLTIASNNTLTNVVAKYNTNGIKMDTTSQNNTFTNITANDNIGYGIRITGVSYNTLTNVTTSNNTNGIYLISSLYSLFTNIVAENNTNYGLFLSGSNYNNLTNVTSNFNTADGINFATSNYNMLTNSTISNNIEKGLSFTDSQNNSIYNNIFNNSLNYYNATDLVNFFNTTLTSGINIVGGNYIGGNYWVYPNGTGYSETCTNGGNGICDTAYNLDNLNYDYLPLTLKAVPTSSVVATTGSSSGGGSGILILPQTSPLEQTLIGISPENPFEMNINQTGFDLTKLIIEVKEKISQISVNLIKVDSTFNEDARMGALSDKIYQIFKVNHSEIGEEKIKNITIDFKVNKTLLLEKNELFQDVKLLRKADNSIVWSPLVTTFVDEDKDSYYFSANSPGLSQFLIFVGKYECQPGTIQCFENQVQFCIKNATWLTTETCDYKCDNEKCINVFRKPNQFYFLIILIVGATIIIVLAILRRVSRRKKKHEEKILKEFSQQKVSLLQKIKRNFRKYQKEREERKISKRAKQRRKLEELKEGRVKDRAKFRRFFNSLKSVLQKINFPQKIISRIKKYQKKREQRKILKKAEEIIHTQNQNRLKRGLEEIKERKAKIKVRIKKFFSEFKFTLHNLNPIQKIKSKFRKYQRKAEEKKMLREIAKQGQIAEKKQVQSDEKIRQNIVLRERKERRAETKAKIRKFFNSFKLIVHKISPVLMIKRKLEKYKKEMEERQNLKKVELHNRKIEQRKMLIQTQNRQRRNFEKRKEKIIEIKAKIRKVFSSLKSRKKKEKPIEKSKEEKKISYKEKVKLTKSILIKKKVKPQSVFNYKERLKKRNVEKKYQIEKLNQLRDKIGHKK